MQGKNNRRSAIAILGLIGVFVISGVLTAASKEYFIEDEIDYIRQAQGITLRVPALIRLANIRLVTLGMKEKSKEDKALEKKLGESHDEYEAKNPPKPALSEKVPGKAPGKSEKPAEK